MTAYCGQCKRDIVGSASLDFCSPTCQGLWQAKLGKPLNPSPIPRPANARRPLSAALEAFMVDRLRPWINVEEDLAIPHIAATYGLPFVGGPLHGNVLVVTEPLLHGYTCRVPLTFNNWLPMPTEEEVSIPDVETVRYTLQVTACFAEISGLIILMVTAQIPKNGGKGFAGLWCEPLRTPR